MASQVDIVITAQDKTEAAFNRVKGQLQTLQGSVRSFATSLATGFAGMAAAYEAMRGIESVTRSVYDNTVAWQSWQYTLTAGGLSSQESQKQLEFLSQTAMELGLNVKDMGTSFARFVLTGRTAGMSLESIDSDFKAISEAMRIFHLSGQQATRSWLALNEVMAMGHLQSRQFTQQLGRDWAGIGPLLAKNFGEAGGSMARFIELMKEGKITGQEFMDTFPKMMETPAMQGALAGAVDSIQSAMGRLQDSWFNLTNEAGNTTALNSATSALNQLATTLSSPEFKQGFDTIITDAAKAADELAKLIVPIEKLNQWAKSINPILGLGKDIEGVANSIARGHLAPELNKLHNEMFQAQEILNVMAENGEKGTEAFNEQAAALAALTSKYQRLQAVFAVKSPPPGGAALPSGAIPALPAISGSVAATDSTKKSKDALQAFIDSQTQEINTMGQSAVAVMQYKMAHGALHDELMKLPPALRAQDEALLKNIAQVKDLKDAMAKLKPVTLDGISEIKQVGTEMTEMGEFAKQAARNMQDSLAHAFDTMGQRGATLRDDLHSLFQSLENDAANMLAKIMLEKAFAGMASSNTSWIAALGSAFGGAHAAGGTVEGGKVSLVGEAGPELFMPHTSGTIIPNSALGSLGGYHSSTVNIDARGAGPDETAKLLAMRQEILAEMRGQTEYRLNRSAWMET